MRLPLLFAACAVAAAAPALPSPAVVLALMRNVTSAFRAAHPPPSSLGDCHWERATYFFGLAEALVDMGAEEEAYARSWARANGYACGGSFAPNDMGAGWGYSALDALAPGVPGALALGDTMTAVLAGGRLPPYSWYWVDTLSMNVPEWVYYGHALNRSDFIDFAHAQYTDTKLGTGAAAQPGLWSSAHGLWFRDHTFVRTSPPVFWARGQAWAAATIVKTLSLDMLPASHPLALDLEATLLAMAAAVVPLQGADGLWRANMLDAAAFPEPETTGTAGLVALLAFGVRTGRLSAATYAPAIAAGWAGLAAALRNESAAVGGCQPEADQPGPSAPESTSDFCTGLWLLAATNVLALARSPPPADLRDFEARLLPRWVAQFALAAPAGGFAFSAGDGRAHAYGAAGVVHALSVVGGLDPSASVRAAIAAVANTFEDRATGFFNLSGPEEDTGFQPWHSGGWVGAALRILGARPAAPPAFAIAIASAGAAVWEATFMPLVNGSAGVNVWAGSHKIAALPVQLMQWDAQWATTYGPFFEWYWGFLNRTSSPRFGYWCLGDNPPPPSNVCLGGAFHVAFTLACGAQPLPNAAAMLDATLALQNKTTGLWGEGVPGYMDQDGVYVAVRASLQLGQARWAAVRDMCAAFVRAAAGQLTRDDAIIGPAAPYGANAHMLAGLVTPVAECARHFPELVVTRAPWADTVDVGCFG